MAVTPYQERQYVQSDAVTKAQQTLQQMQAQKPGAYQSQFQTGMNDLMGQIQNRPKFQYDVNADALYQQVAQNYMQQGQQAMMDTMGQAAAMTGGYGNSYAQTAGQQQYNNHLLGLAEMVPQFQQMALQQYQMEGDDLMDRYAMLAQQEDMAYGRYQDDLNRYYADLDRAQAAFDNERDYDYSRFADDRAFDYGKYQDELNHQYRTDRDKVADDQWLQQWIRQQERDRITDSQWDQQMQYQKEQDQRAYEQWLQEMEYQKELDRIAQQQWQMEYEESIRQFNESLAANSSPSVVYYSGGDDYEEADDNVSISESQFVDMMNNMDNMTTQQAASLITQAAKEGIIDTADQLNYMFIYG